MRHKNARDSGFFMTMWMTCQWFRDAFGDMLAGFMLSDRFHLRRFIDSTGSEIIKPKA